MVILIKDSNKNNNAEKTIMTNSIMETKREDWQWVTIVLYNKNTTAYITHRWVTMGRKDHNSERLCKLLAEASLNELQLQKKRNVFIWSHTLYRTSEERLWINTDILVDISLCIIRWLETPIVTVATVEIQINIRDFHILYSGKKAITILKIIIGRTHTIIYDVCDFGNTCRSSNRSHN